MKFIIIAIFLFVTTYFCCSLFWKDVNCRSKLFLTIINTTEAAKKITFTNFSDHYNSDFVKITFTDSNKTIASYTQNSSIFEYSWIGNDECAFSDAFFEDYRIDVDVSSSDSVMLHYQVYPFDTTIKYQNICVGCMHEYYDTIVIK